MDSSEKTLVDKLGDALFKLKTYWRKPPKGYYVTYKEFLNFSLGFGGISFLSVIVQWTTLATTVHMMISYFKISTGLMWLLTIAAALVALFRAPILSMIIDNSNSAKGKFKPFLIWSSIAASVTLSLIPFVPNAWNSINLFSFVLPAIPLVGVTEASTISVSLAVLMMFILLQVGTFFHMLMTQAMNGIEQTITSVAQERANIGAIKGLICNIPSSIVNLLLPVMAGSIFAGLGGWNAIQMYRWAFPFCAVGAVVCVIFTVRGTEERVVVNQRYRAKVKFFEGAKELSKNKYFWIITVLHIAVAVRNYCNLTTWITQYSFQSDIIKTIVGIYCTTLLMTILVLGMVLGPIVIKKWGKRKVMIVSNVGFAVMILFQFLVYDHPVLILLAAFLQNVFSGFYYINTIMVSDVLDYQQWKTGKRLEGFWQNYNNFIITIASVATSVLLPIFLSFAGVGFSDDISLALQDAGLRSQIFKYQTLLALIGAVVAMIPVFFYDLTEAKHANIIRVLKIRAAANNYADGALLDIDVLNVHEILEYANENDDAFLKDEFEKHDCIEAILANYEEVKLRTEENDRAEEQADFERNLELENKRLDAKKTAARAKAEKKGLPFDEDDYTARFVRKSRFLCQLDENGNRIVPKTEETVDELELATESVTASTNAADSDVVEVSADTTDADDTTGSGDAE